MNTQIIPHIGMRKFKSILAVAVSFVIWQIIRLFIPGMETHPVFAYIYAIIEMRDTPVKTKKFGLLRIKSTFVGLIVGLFFVSVSIKLCSLTEIQWHHIYIDFVLVLIATLVSLTVAEVTKCDNFCGIAAIIAVVCIVSHSDTDRYLYATMRVLQTVLGVFSAFVINTFIRRKNSKENPEENNQ